MPQLRQHQRVGCVDLVDHQNLRRRLLPGFLHDSTDHGVHCLDLFQRERVGAIHNVQHHVGGQDFLQSGTERLHQLRGQVADEAHRVAEHHRSTVREARATRRRIQGGEQGILNQHTRTRQCVNQGGLARVRVSRNRDLRDGRGVTPLSLDLAGGLHRRNLLA